MTIDRDTMIRFVRGELDVDTHARVQELVASNPAVRAQVERIRTLDALVIEATPDSFAPYFGDRVMKRVMQREGKGGALYDSLQWVFLRLAAASLIAVIGLGLYNGLEASSSGFASSPVEAVFGLPSSDVDNLYYLQGI